MFSFSLRSHTFLAVFRLFLRVVPRLHFSIFSEVLQLRSQTKVTLPAYLQDLDSIWTSIFQNMLLRSLLRTSAAKKLSQLSVTSEALRCSSAPTFAKIVSFHPTWRSFAAEAGYLDKGEVTNRVLEVVRKFEKVRSVATLCFITSHAHPVDGRWVSTISRICETNYEIHFCSCRYNQRRLVILLILWMILDWIAWILSNL